MRSLRFEGMTKAYGGVAALSGVDLALGPGRIHALMGENGAGKSTLIKLVAGVVAADRGTVRRDGAVVPLAGPRDAHAAGFRVIHQEADTVPRISVAENVLLGRPLPRRLGLAVDWRAARGRAREALVALGADHVDPAASASTLPPGDRVLVRIAAALAAEPGTAEPVLYVLDEPTSALTDAEAARLFAVLRRLAARGAAILYVSHRMDEVMGLCDDVSVLRDGRLVSCAPVAATTKAAVIRAMTGRDVRDAYPPRTGPAPGAAVVRLRGVRTAGLSGLELTLRAGEVLGVAGLAASGQSELLRLLLGLAAVLAGDAEMGGGPLPRSPADAWARGVAYVPRDRRGEALMLRMPVRANILLPHLGAFGLRARRGAEAARARSLAARVRLRSEGPEQAVGDLSGGNQQKVVFARALAGAPRLLLLDEPTRGVDVGAKWDIYALVRERAAEGCAVVLTSSDLPEVLGMADRVLVLRRGRQAALVARGTLDPAALLALCQHDARDAAA